MAESMIYDYYYGDESSQFSFYRIPRQLVTGQQHKLLPGDKLILFYCPLDEMPFRIFRCPNTLRSG